MTDEDWLDGKSTTDTDWITIIVSSVNAELPPAPSIHPRAQIRLASCGADPRP